MTVNKWTNILLIAVLSLSLSAICGSAGADQPEFIQIIDIDTYEKTVWAGESTTYNWTIRNIDSTADLTVSAGVHLADEGWTVELSMYEFTLAPGNLSSVTATVHAPFEKGDVISNLTVVFDVRESGYLVQVVSVSASTEIVGAFGSANKVLGLFDNPLPSPLDNEWGVFLLDVVIWLGIAFGVAYLMDAVAYGFTRRTTTMLDDIILGIIRTPMLLLVFAYGVVNSLDALHAHIPLETQKPHLTIYGATVVLVLLPRVQAVQADACVLR